VLAVAALLKYRVVCENSWAFQCFTRHWSFSDFSIDLVLDSDGTIIEISIWFD